MIEQKTVELKNLTLDVRLLTANGDAHSKVGDHPDVIAKLWGELKQALMAADQAIEVIPNKEIRLAEGCK